MQNLGWANNQESFREQGGYDIMKKCREARHSPTDKDEGPPFRGIQHHVICKDCGYEYFYDSSD